MKIQKPGLPKMRRSMCIPEIVGPSCFVKSHTCFTLLAGIIEPERSVRVPPYKGCYQKLDTTK